MGQIWTPDRVAALRELRGQGLSVNECARSLSVSRGSILGKLLRLGMCKACRSRDPPAFGIRNITAKTAKARHRQSTARRQHSTGATAHAIRITQLALPVASE
jgi:hypothetical protein